MRKVLLAVVAGFAIGGAASAQPNDLAFHDFTGRAMAEVVVPALAALTNDAETLRADMASLCAALGADALATARAGYAVVVADWARIMPLQLDLLLADSRRERFFFWPDPRGITLRQIQAALGDRDPTLTDPATLQGKSVALQGLGALEYLLFGTGADTLTATGDEAGAHRCAYGSAIAVNLAAVAVETAADAAPDGRFGALIAGPAADNPLYRAEIEPVADLILSAVTAIELVRDSVLAQALGTTTNPGNTRLAPLWRSGLTLPFVQSMMAATLDLLTAPGLATLLPPDRAWIEDQIRGEFGNLLAALPADASIEAAVADADLRRRLVLVGLIADNLKFIIGTSLPEALGLNLGFNALDGD